MQVSTAVVYSLLSAGVVFGYAALKPVLIEEGVYRNRCRQDEVRKQQRLCYGQEMRLNLMFTVAAVSTNVWALPVGVLLDRFGPRLTSVLGCAFFSLGLGLLAIGADAAVDTYLPGFMFLAIGAPFLFIPTFHLSNAFPPYSGLILTLLTGAFDASSAVFLLYRVVYESSRARVKPRAFFLFYLLVPVCSLVLQLFVMPSTSYQAPAAAAAPAADPSSHAPAGRSDAPSIGDSFLGHAARMRPDAADESRAEGETAEPASGVTIGESTGEISVEYGAAQVDTINVDESTSLLGRARDREQLASSKQKGRARRDRQVPTALHHRSAKDQILTPWWLLMALFTLVQMTRINYYIATMQVQNEFLLRDPAAAARINRFFDLALPLGGVVAIPAVGYLLDNTSLVLILSLMVVSATAVGILAVIPTATTAYATVIIFVVYRPFFYTAVS